MAAETKRAGVGRRGGDADTRGDILRTARRQFASGFAAATLRSIAREAGVDPSLIIQFFGSKDGLFLAAMADAVRPGEAIPTIIAGGRENLGRRLATWFFGIWEDPLRRHPVQAIFVSAAAHPAAADLLRDFVRREFAERVASISRRKDAQLRAELVGSHLLGTALARYVYEIPPLSEVPLSAIVPPVGAAIDNYLFPGRAGATRSRTARAPGPSRSG